MAKITKGILGGVSGKIGRIVGSHYQGKSFVRSLPKRKPKVPKNELRSNGYNLLDLVYYFAFVKSSIVFTVNDNNLDLSIDWNEVTKSVLGSCQSNPKGYYSPILLGKNQLVSTQEFLCRPPTGDFQLRIVSEACTSMLLNHPNSFINYRVLDSTGYYGSLIRIPVTQGIIQVASDGGSVSQDYWRMIIAWFSNSDNSLRSKVSVAFRCDF